MLQLLAPEQVTFTSIEPAQHAEDSVRAIAQEAVPKPIAPQTPTPDEDLLGSIRIGWRDLAGETAQSIRRLSQATVEQALEIGQRLLRMQRDLKRKEYATFLSVLGWASAKARKFINLAKTFSEFESSHLIGIELTTLLSLCSKRYQEVVAQLQEMQDITQQEVEELLKENLAPRKPKQEPISGWKQNRVGGGRYYNVLLHDEEAGLLIEQQAETEGTLPQKVIAEAVALRAQHKSGSIPLSEYRAAQLEELHTVVDNARTLEREKRGLELELDKRDRTIAELEAKLTERASVPAEMCSEDLTGLHVEQELEPEFLEPLHSMGAGLEDSMGDGLEAQVEQAREPEASNATDSSEPVLEASVQTPEAVEETCSTATPQAAEPPEAVQETACLEPSDKASATDCQITKPDWDVLKLLRGAEAGLRKIDNQIQPLKAKLVNSDSGEIVKREVTPVLKKHQNLRSAKISEIVGIINSNSISGYYEELENVGRVVLAAEYASVALKQAKSWVEVMLVSGSDGSALLRAVKHWTYDSKQLLVQLLSTYLETESSALEQINWIPEKLLHKALSTLSFGLEKIRSSDNLVDEPEMEQICGCKFKSVANIGTPREQWFFQARDKVLDVFGRSGFAVEKF